MNHTRFVFSTGSVVSPCLGPRLQCAPGCPVSSPTPPGPALVSPEGLQYRPPGTSGFLVHIPLLHPTPCLLQVRLQGALADSCPVRSYYGLSCARTFLLPILMEETLPIPTWTHTAQHSPGHLSWHRQAVLWIQAGGYTLHLKDHGETLCLSPPGCPGCPGLTLW